MGRGTKKSRVKRVLKKRIEGWEEGEKKKLKHKHHKPGSMSGKK